MPVTLHIASCQGCPFSGDSTEIDCTATRTPVMRKPDIRSVIASDEHGTPPPALCPLRSYTITIQLGPPT
jgi:hypothetical protein